MARAMQADLITIKMPTSNLASVEATEDIRAALESGKRFATSTGMRLRPPDENGTQRRTTCHHNFSKGDPALPILTRLSEICKDKCAIGSVQTLNILRKIA